MKKPVYFLMLLAALLLPVASDAHDNVVVVPLGGDNVKVQAKTFTKNISAADFRPGYRTPLKVPGYSYLSGHAFSIVNYGDSDSMGLSTSLDLPDGATLLGVTCYMQDNDADYNARANSLVKITRREFTSMNSEDIITPISMATSGQSADITPLSSSSIIYPAIDTDTYFYVIRYFMQITDNVNGFPDGPYSALINFWGCSISYSLDVLTR